MKYSIVIKYDKNIFSYISKIEESLKHYNFEIIILSKEDEINFSIKDFSYSVKSIIYNGSSINDLLRN